MPKVHAIPHNPLVQYSKVPSNFYPFHKRITNKPSLLGNFFMSYKMTINFSINKLEISWFHTVPSLL